jgi:2-polyprenyl-6-methoxyphenol hydroxylase-like FAD-dependent oxidoreductase
MPVPINLFIASFLLLLPVGCGVYYKQGHGIIVKSKLDSDLQTPLLAAADGTVSQVRLSLLYGKQVMPTYPAPRLGLEWQAL